MPMLVGMVVLATAREEVLATARAEVEEQEDTWLPLTDNNKVDILTVEMRRVMGMELVRRWITFR